MNETETARLLEVRQRINSINGAFVHLWLAELDDFRRSLFWEFFPNGIDSIPSEDLDRIQRICHKFSDKKYEF